ncbi:GDP/UDP-N,N'-diacetylbacillosamine 2-epimerase (hydrolysing) [Tibeticola sediminis]|jgi:GDP/UDP-N,N'-diacetylbacillosamine 2-epimerase (hydrolysing)|uniref:GDP/UDP-N,N'-diacetylbacillosamine 2-epimerase (Hydrolysing) n=1 Tax=Tibeticola sediminis TaxID=1917811 RepID=A0A3N4U412_9BURK|nr:UDP-N-acetylglucosamine 2-epimerase [Tibeticola sediminis]RPE64568.1 GDP/UDP-N,N'-diacetylbacillosamine 2-epimerase (hydrolysing) [Tibeticola sediminis]
MSGPRRSVLYVTGTRADFGLMRHVLQAIDAHPRLRLQLAVTGMHLSPAFGETVREIEASGLSIAARMPTEVDARSPAAMARGIGHLVGALTDVLERERPDLLLLLGDRGEMLAGAIAALHLGIPVVHLHGGERSGTVDEPVRHAITKLSHWHFVATEGSRERVIRMGERPEHVWVTGAPSLDGLAAVLDAPRDRTLARLGLDAAARYALVLFHPVVQQMHDAAQQTQALADALGQAARSRDLHLVWLEPNADAGSAGILQALDAASAQLGARLVRITHLERPHYLEALRHADLLAGNSSSGIIEAASLGTPVLNVGDRQRGRERNANTFDCGVRPAEIAAALQQALAHGRFAPANVYGDGRAAERIVELLADTPIAPDLLDKINTY